MGSGYVCLGGCFVYMICLLFVDENVFWIMGFLEIVCEFKLVLVYCIWCEFGLLEFFFWCFVIVCDDWDGLMFVFWLLDIDGFFVVIFEWVV